MKTFQLPTAGLARSQTGLPVRLLTRDLVHMYTTPILFRRNKCAPAPRIAIAPDFDGARHDSKLVTSRRRSGPTSVSYRIEAPPFLPGRKTSRQSIKTFHQSCRHLNHVRIAYRAAALMMTKTLPLPPPVWMFNWHDELAFH
jgi:hypothetical protein